MSRAGMLLRVVARRLLVALPVAWLVVTLTFVMVHVAPGSVEDMVANPDLTPSQRELIRRHWGLDEPLPLRYLTWLGSLATGDLGISFLYRKPVSWVLWQALPPTVLLTASALFVEISCGLLLAVLGFLGSKRVDAAIAAFVSAIYGVPSFCLALLFSFLFAEVLGWFPPSHMHSVGVEGLGLLAMVADLLPHLVLPALALGLPGVAVWARYFRSGLEQAAAAPYVVAFRARGIDGLRLVLGHAARPALVPVATAFGLAFPRLVSGSLVVETIFSWPGMGRLAWHAAMARDLPLILAVTWLGAVAVIVGNLLADLAHLALDPRQGEPRR